VVSVDILITSDISKESVLLMTNNLWMYKYPPELAPVQKTLSRY